MKMLEKFHIYLNALKNNTLHLRGLKVVWVKTNKITSTEVGPGGDRHRVKTVTGQDGVGVGGETGLWIKRETGGSSKQWQTGGQNKDRQVKTKW